MLKVGSDSQLFIFSIFSNLYSRLNWEGIEALVWLPGEPGELLGDHVAGLLAILLVLLDWQVDDDGDGDDVE